VSKNAKSIEKLDATARELCRLFADGHPTTDVRPTIKGLKKTEVAFVVAFAADRMAPSTRSAFINFLRTQLPPWPVE
jgi:hypothetical protein